MTFSEACERLAREFEKDVNEEKSIYLPFSMPNGPVDFVLVGMEPSLGRWASTDPKKACEEARKKREQGFKNFAWSIDDFILHHCIRNYLCQDMEAYYLTDLSKGAMLTKQAKDDRRERYEKWYPILEKEIGLVAKPETKIISIGNVVGSFLSGKALYGHAGTILHYSSQAGRHRGQERRRQPEEYSNFSSSIKLSHVVQTAEQVLKEGGVSSPLTGDILQRLGRKRELTDSSKELMFSYKVNFGRIRDQDELGWLCWRREWQQHLS